MNSDNKMKSNNKTKSDKKTDIQEMNENKKKTLFSSELYGSEKKADELSHSGKEKPGENPSENDGNNPSENPGKSTAKGSGEDARFCYGDPSHNSRNFPQPKKRKWTAGQIFLLHLGVLLVALGVYFFKFPNHFIMGGVSGLSILLAQVTPLTPGVWTWVLNISLLILGYLALGRSFAFGTAYASLMLSSLILIFERFIPLSAPLTDQPLLELAFAALLPAVGSALLFNLRVSTGGSDVLAMLIHRKSEMNIGYALAAFDFAIAMISFLIFDLKTVLFSIIGLLFKGVIVDAMIEQFNDTRFFTIVTTKPDSIAPYIINELHRGATLMEGHGIFTGEDRKILLCAVPKVQAIKLRDFVRSEDPLAFISISTHSEVVGRGFGGTF